MPAHKPSKKMWTLSTGFDGHLADHHRSNTVDKVHTLFERVINREEGLGAAKISRGATPASRAESKQRISLKS